MSITYASNADGVTAGDLAAYFDGWSSPPSEDERLRMVRAADRVVLARDGDELVGIITALTDGVMWGFIPYLEVRETHRARGIGSELVRRMLEELGSIYAIDLVCDDDLIAFYERFEMRAGRAMMLRRYVR